MGKIARFFFGAPAKEVIDKSPEAETSLDPQAMSINELVDMLGVGVTASGEPVTETTALKVTTVYRCIELIGSSIKVLPFNVHERNGDAHQPIDHDYNWLFNCRANIDMTSSDAWQFLITSKFTHGDGFAELIRASYRSSKVIGWEPLHPDKVDPFRDRLTGIKYYRVTRENGEQEVLDQADVIQLTSLGYDGLRSPSPITYAASEAIGTAIAGQKWSGKFFDEGATFDYALSTDAKMSRTQLKDVKDTVIAREKNSRMPLVLSGGLKPAQLTINPRDAEILASRLFTIEEICRIFGVFPFMVGHTNKSTSWQSGLESMGSTFVRYTLLSHLTQIEQEFNYKLWPARSKRFLDHNTSQLERGDMKSRFDAYRSALGRAGEPGWISVNEVRKRENMAPAADGDELFKPEITEANNGEQSNADA
ncbi:phage portal protein [Photobacterium profundum]|jgi:HK97 family phage portal protein|uniref:phage portal protein n=1 Tax=Photobacterium profundum TaxID=74109 RepID=UPI003D11AFE9